MTERPPTSAVQWWRLWSLQGSFNTRRMQSLGWLVAIAGVWRQRGLTKSQLAEILPLESTSSNTHPYLVGLAVGARLALEEDGDPEAGRQLADGLSRALGGLGDRVFWGTAVPCVALLALTLLMVAGPWPALGLWIGVAAALSWFRQRALHEGYRRGTAVVELLDDPRVELLVRRLRLASALLVGGLVGMMLGRTWVGERLRLDFAAMGVGAAIWGMMAARRGWSAETWGLGLAAVAWIELAVKAWIF